MTEKTFKQWGFLTFTQYTPLNSFAYWQLTVEERDISHNLMIFHFFLLSFEWVISDLEVVVRRQFCLSRYNVNMDIGIYEALGVEGERMSLKWYCEERKYVAVSFITHI